MSFTKVFVASRFSEFEKLRAALTEHHDHHQIQYIALDDGQPASVGPLDRSLSELNNSDLMILFLGETIGDAVNSHQGLSISIVEHEWEFAQSEDIPCLVWFKQELIEKLSVSEVPPFSNLEKFALRILESGVTVGELHGEDSLKVAQRIEIELFGSVIPRRSMKNGITSGFHHDEIFVKEFNRKSKAYDLPLDEEGPSFAKPNLMARAGAQDLLSRRLPSEAFEQLLQIGDIRICSDLSLLWLLGEMFCRYANDIENRVFAEKAQVLAERLLEIRESIPIGAMSTQKTNQSRIGLVVLVASRLLITVWDRELNASQKISDDLGIRKSMKMALDELQRTKLHSEDLEAEARVLFRLSNCVETSESLKERFFRIWHWRPNLAISVLQHTSTDLAVEIVGAVINEARRDFATVFPDELRNIEISTEKSPQNTLKLFRRKVRNLVDIELENITSLFLKFDPEALGKSLNLSNACRFPSLYVSRYQPLERRRKFGDVYWKNSGNDEDRKLTVLVPPKCQFTEVPIHAYSDIPDLQLLWENIKAHLEEENIIPSSHVSNVKTLEEVWGSLSKSTDAALFKLESITRQKVIALFGSFKNFVETGDRIIELGLRKSLKESPIHEFSLRSELHDLWIENWKSGGMTLRELEKHVEKKSADEIRTWLKHDGVSALRATMPNELMQVELSLENQAREAKTAIENGNEARLSREFLTSRYYLDLEKMAEEIIGYLQVHQDARAVREFSAMEFAVRHERELGRISESEQNLREKEKKTRIREAQLKAISDEQLDARRQKEILRCKKVNRLRFYSFLAIFVEFIMLANYFGLMLIFRQQLWFWVPAAQLSCYAIVCRLKFGKRDVGMGLTKSGERCKHPNVSVKVHKLGHLCLKCVTLVESK